TLVQLSTVASIHDYAGDCPKALAIARTVRGRMAARYGEKRQATLIETGNLGFKERDCGERETGLDYLRQAERGLREHFGEDNVAAHSFRYALAMALADEGRHHEGLRMVDGLNVVALTAADSTPGWEHRLRALRGRLLLQAGDAHAGRTLLAGAVPALVALGSEDPAEIASLQALLSGAGSSGAGEERRRQETTKVPRMFTRHSVPSPSGSVTALTSLTQAPWMFLTDSAAFFRPVRTASSTLVVDEELSSMIFATAMRLLRLRDETVAIATACRGRC